MKNGSGEELSRLDKLVMVPAEPGACVNAVFVYEDAQTREWAREAHARIAGLADKQGVRPTWWRLENLGAPGVLAAAVSTAMRADVLVIAARTAVCLPLAFYAWINSWLPNRLHRGGVLVALLGKSGQKSGSVEDYLREVARQSRLDFLLARRKIVPGPLYGLNGDSGAPHLNGHSIGRLRAA